MVKSGYLVLTFESTHAAMAAQKYLKDRIPHIVMPVPRCISASCGIAIRVESGELDRLQAQLGTVKDVEAGHGISYGRTYLTPSDTSTAIVPLGYADGIHRSASGFDMEGAKHVTKPGGPVRVMTAEGPRLYRVSGRVCMDQFILDLHGSAAELGIHEGDNVELFGPGRGEDYAEPTADDWGRAADTISYEIFTCLRNRIPRLYEHATDVLSAEDLAKLDPASIL